jgi:hypothetical protein
MGVRAGGSLAMLRAARSNGRVDRRMRWYLGLMGTCITLLALAWFLVRLWSVPVAIGMSIVAAFIPPVAVIIANAGRLK